AGGGPAPPADPRIVDQQIWYPMVDDDPTEHLLDGSRIAHIQHERECPRLLRQPIETGCCAGDRHHSHPSRGQSLDQPPPNPSAASPHASTAPHPARP